MKPLFRLLISLVFSFTFFSKGSYCQDNNFIKENFAFAGEQLHGMLRQADPATLAFPRGIDKNGKLVTTNMYGWTSGFFPGSLWYAAEFLKDSTLEKAAKSWTNALESLQYFTDHHDLGFMMYNSYGNAYRLTGNEEYKKILIQAARSLSTRFNAVTGCIKSWNRFASWHDRNKTYSFPVIIDNMMNLELLFFASRMTGDRSFSDLAITHALTTMKNHLRPDHSSYHVVCYDTITGQVLTKETGQGYADNSTWARGHAWGIYGFTMTYRETKDKRFLETARGMADWFIKNKNLPGDKVPFWDFNAGQPGFVPAANSNAKNLTTIFRDASAAAITASALMELSVLSGRKGKKYREVAIEMIRSLGGPAYRAQPGNNGNFLLMHSVGSIPNNSEIDVPIVYADYYFLEALKRYNDWYLAK